MTTLGRLSRLAEEVIETSFATVVYAELDPETGVCRYASAGHPPPLAATLAGALEALRPGPPRAAGGAPGRAPAVPRRRAGPAARHGNRVDLPPGGRRASPRSAAAL